MVPSNLRRFRRTGLDEKLIVLRENRAAFIDHPLDPLLRFFLGLPASHSVSNPSADQAADSKQHQRFLPHAKYSFLLFRSPSPKYLPMVDRLPKLRSVKNSALGIMAKF